MKNTADSPIFQAGIFWSFVGQSLASKLSGRTLMAIGATAYLTSAILLIFIREHTSYWKLLFPALLISVIGADFQFIVSNVSYLPLYLLSSPCQTNIFGSYM